MDEEKKKQRKARDEQRVRDRLARIAIAAEMRNAGVRIVVDAPCAPEGYVEIQRDMERSTFALDEDAARWISPNKAQSISGIWYVPITDAIDKLGRYGVFGTDGVLLAELRDLARTRRVHRREACRAQRAWLDLASLIVQGREARGTYLWHATLANLYRAQEASRGSRIRARRAEAAWLAVRPSNILTIADVDAAALFRLDVLPPPGYEVTP